ncbi:MAG TPA: YicC/YloC family endoribonuclease [Balneolales bacterium]|nr:YicC/YloC family endoribonuclease [Balneolales bacterium]
MLVSMTGFGRGESSDNGMTATVEIKSVNSRFSDISIRLPQSLRDKETEFRELIQQHIERGKFNVSIKLEKQDLAELDITIDPKVVASYRQLLTNLKDSAGIKEPISLSHYLSFNDLFVTRESDEEELKAMAVLVRDAIKKALHHLNSMRSQEGGHLAEDLLMRLDNIEDILQLIGKRADERVPEARDKFHERIENLINDDNFDKERLELELAILADKLDITEEIVRLQSHIKFFREAMERNGSVGRKLNFLIQEMNREINTIGSKANDSQISHNVVDLKEILEKIREQIQNIE